MSARSENGPSVDQERPLIRLAIGRDRTDRFSVDIGTLKHGWLPAENSGQVDIAIIHGYTSRMDVSIAEAKNRLPELIRAVEGGAAVVITRHGKPVAQLAPPPMDRRQVRLGGMKNRIRLLPGWDAPVDVDSFLGDE